MLEVPASAATTELSPGAEPADPEPADPAAPSELTASSEEGQPFEAHGQDMEGGAGAPGKDDGHVEEHDWEEPEAVGGPERYAATGGDPIEPPKLLLLDPPPPIDDHGYRPSDSARRNGAARLLGSVAGELAPDIRWVPGDRLPPTLSDQRGRVVVIYTFQGWCPGCQSRGFPVTTDLGEQFAEQAVELIYVQTTFEGFGANDYNRAASEQGRWRITRPIGHDRPEDEDERPRLMTQFRTGGTPWTIVLDPWGRIRFNDFTRSKEFHRGLVSRLLEEAAPHEIAEP